MDMVARSGFTSRLAIQNASYIAIAGKERQAYKNTHMMIHEPMTGMWGNQYDLREIADVLEQISDSMIDMYADNSNIGIASAMADQWG